MQKWEHSQLGYHSHAVVTGGENVREDQRLEFMIFGDPTKTKTYEVVDSNVEEILGNLIKDLGLNGWELVSAVRTTDQIGPIDSLNMILKVFYYFKRPIE